MLKTIAKFNCVAFRPQLSQGQDGPGFRGLSAWPLFKGTGHTPCLYASLAQVALAWTRGPPVGMVTRKAAGASWEGHAHVKKEGPGPGRRPNSVPAARPEAVPTLGPTGGSSLPDGSLHLHDRKSHALADNSKEALSRLVWLSEETRLPPPTPRATCPHPPPGEDARPQGRLGCHLLYDAAS